MLGRGAAAVFVLAGLSGPASAFAQYRGQQVGFEAGYHFIGEELRLEQHAPIFGLRAGYKATDHWWFTARAMVGFRGDEALLDATTVVFHLTPVEARYYLLTDSIRPFLGFGTTFQFLIGNEIDGRSIVQWGFGPGVGIELKLRRDLFLGFQVDGLYLINFGGPDVPMVHATTQLLFFL